jgi:hypothetical protein
VKVLTGAAGWAAGLNRLGAGVAAYADWPQDCLADRGSRVNWFGVVFEMEGPLDLLVWAAGFAKLKK